MNINLDSGISGFFTVFGTVINWLRTTVFTIGPISFDLFSLTISVIAVCMIINFVYRLLE